MTSPIKLLVGLGNPGNSYAAHRHNIGFMAIDRIAEEYRLPNFAKKFQGEISEGKIGEQKIILLKPQTYMNLSGESVGAVARFYKIEPQEIAVFHDELDIPLGEVRVKKGGGSGGHNGIKSIDQHLGRASERLGVKEERLREPQSERDKNVRSEAQNNYWRVRLGIGHPGSKELVTEHVLSNFTREEALAVNRILETAFKQLPLLLQGNLAGFSAGFV